MDGEKRKNAQLKIESAKNLKLTRSPRDQVLNEYLQGIVFYLQIVNKSTDDFIALSGAYYNMAIIYFNAKDYTKAGQYYIDSINQLLQTELNDAIYRKLTERYIDLADTCYELVNQDAANEAMTNAIKAFNLIKIKNAKELEIGDPISNFKKFHDYYERQLSTDSYLQSSNFRNYEQLLGEKQQENALFAQFDSISIVEANQIDETLQSMITHLALTDRQGPQLFSPVLINQAPDDPGYRNMAMQYLQLAQSHIQKRMLADAIKTYNQVIDTLTLIKEPQEKDRQIIENLKEQIVFLGSKPISSGSQSDHQRPKSSASVGGFFASTPSEIMDEEIVDNGMYL